MTPYLISMATCAALALVAAVAFGSILMLLVFTPETEHRSLLVLGAAVSAATVILCLGLVRGFVLGLLAAERGQTGP